MKPTKVRYTLRNGKYLRTSISNAGTFLNQQLSSDLPEFASVDELPTKLVKTLINMKVVIYELNTKYYDRYGIPGIVEAVVS